MSALFVALWALFHLTGCTEPQVPRAARAPATQTPFGLLEIKSAKAGKKTKSAKPEIRATTRSIALSNFARLAERSGLIFHELQHRGEAVAALVEIDLKRFSPRVITASKNANKSLRPADAISSAQTRVIVGSSFVSQVDLSQPLGVLQVNGELLQAVEPYGYTRILGITRGSSARFEVAHRSEWPVERFSSALQAGPGIVEEGALDISERDLSRQKYFRSFVAECGERSIVGATLVPMHLYTLGSELVEFFAARSLDCREVVNLAGDRESVLLVRNSKEVAFLGDPVPAKAGLIGFSLNPKEN